MNPEIFKGIEGRRVVVQPGKIFARKAVFHALRNGKLTRQPCEECGTTDRVEAHHYSYRKEHRLQVNWLCTQHHADTHRMLARAGEMFNLAVMGG
jgi:hypothetical protein